MQALIQPLLKLNEYGEIQSRLKSNRGVLQLSGCIESQKAHVIYGLGQEKKNRLIVTENELKAKELYEDMRFYDPDVMLYPARDLIFFQADIHGNLLTKQRMRVIAALLEKKNVTVVTSMSGCMEYLMPLSVIKDHVLHFRNDSVIDVEKLKKDLINMGFEYNVQAEAPGQFAVRGGIIDIRSVLNYGMTKLIRSEVLMQRARDRLKIWKKSGFILRRKWCGIMKFWKKV